MSLRQLTGGRFVLGVGVSGPEGHGGLARSSVRQANPGDTGDDRDHGVSTLALKLGGPLSVRLDTLAQKIELAGEVSREPAV